MVREASAAAIPGAIRAMSPFCTATSCAPARPVEGSSPAPPLSRRSYMAGLYHGPPLRTPSPAPGNMRGSISVTGSLIGCARMYGSSPTMSRAWREFLTWISSTSRVDLDIIEHAYPAPLDELWERPDMGCVFMCGYPWALRHDRPRLLASPVPSPPRYGNQPVYFTDFVVRADSAFKTLEDTFGRRLAYSIENSHSGYNAARYHLLAYRTPARRSTPKRSARSSRSAACSTRSSTVAPTSVPSTAICWISGASTFLRSSPRSA